MMVEYQKCRQCEEVVDVGFFFDETYCCETCYEQAHSEYARESHEDHTYQSKKDRSRGL